MVIIIFWDLDVQCEGWTFERGVIESLKVQLISVIGAGKVLRVPQFYCLFFFFNLKAGVVLLAAD